MFVEGAVFGAVAVLLIHWRVNLYLDRKEKQDNCPHYHVSKIHMGANTYRVTCKDCAKEWIDYN